MVLDRAANVRPEMFAPLTVSCSVGGANISPVLLAVKVYVPVGNPVKLKAPELLVVAVALLVPVNLTATPAPRVVGPTVPVTLHVDVDEDAGLTRIEVVLVTALAVAFNVTAWTALTATALAVKPTLVFPQATLTNDGTLTAGDPVGSAMASATLCPPLGAALEIMTVQAEEPGPTIVAGLQAIPLTVSIVCAIAR